MFVRSHGIIATLRCVGDHAIMGKELVLVLVNDSNLAELIRRISKADTGNTSTRGPWIDGI